MLIWIVEVRILLYTTTLVHINDSSSTPGGPLPIELGGDHGPQFLEKINEFLKLTIDFFNNFDVCPPPHFKPVADPLLYTTSRKWNMHYIDYNTTLRYKF